MERKKKAHTSPDDLQLSSAKFDVDHPEQSLQRISSADTQSSSASSSLEGPGPRGPVDVHEHLYDQEGVGTETHADDQGSDHERTSLVLEQQRSSSLSSQAYSAPINSHIGILPLLDSSSSPRDSRRSSILPPCEFDPKPLPVVPSLAKPELPSFEHLAYRREGPSSDNDRMNDPERTGRNKGGKLEERASPTVNPDYDLAVYQPRYQWQYEENPLSIQHHQASASLGSLIQHPPPDRSQIGPSGSFFEGSSGIGISGGKFNQTYGHHTNVTIHVNQPREEDGTQRQQLLHSSAPLSWASPSRVPIYNTVSPATQDVHRSHFPARSMHEQVPLTSTSIYNIGSPPTRDIQHGEFPSTSINEQGRSSSTTMYSPDNSNKIYERLLCLKQRGFPLWIPEPSRTLPIPYRRKGVNIGDVGIITPSGGFSFLFNICSGNDDPINPPILPDGFSPIYPPIKQTDIREYPEFKPESYMASTAIEKTHNDPPFLGLSFATSSAEGAVLTLPDGAIARDLANIRRFRAYAAANIESWYRYVNGPLGCEVKNGEIRLVVGCDKATSWGMAAVANLSQHKTHYLKYRSVGDGAVTAPIPLYKWEYTGLADARVGPDLPEIEELKRDDDSDVAVGGKYLNQCLFMRTLNPTLSDEVFEAIDRELEAELIQESRQFQNGGRLDNVPNGPSNSGSQKGSNDLQPETNSGAQTGSTSESSESATEKLSVVGDRVTMSRSPSAPILHPADVLNKILLQKVPTGRVVITQDEDWSSIINEDDETMLSPSEIAERVLAVYHVSEEDGRHYVLLRRYKYPDSLLMMLEGVIFLEPKKEHQLALHHRRRISFSHSARDYSISISPKIPAGVNPLQRAVPLLNDISEPRSRDTYTHHESENSIKYEDSVDISLGFKDGVDNFEPNDEMDFKSDILTSREAYIIECKRPVKYEDSVDKYDISLDFKSGLDKFETTDEMDFKLDPSMGKEAYAPKSERSIKYEDSVDNYNIPLSFKDGVDKFKTIDEMDFKFDTLNRPLVRLQQESINESVVTSPLVQPLNFHDKIELHVPPLSSFGLEKGKGSKIDMGDDLPLISIIVDKKPQQKWSAEETNMLVKGCHSHGVGNWETILQDPTLKFHDRSAVDLEDRFRTYFPDAYETHFPNAHMDPSRNMMSTLSDRPSLFGKPRRKQRRQFTEAEDRALKAGYEKHGKAWATIVKDPIFQEQARRSTDLRDRFRKAFPGLYHAAGYKPRTPSKKKLHVPLQPGTDEQAPSYSTRNNVIRRDAADVDPDNGDVEMGDDTDPLHTSDSLSNHAHTDVDRKESYFLDYVLLPAVHSTRSAPLDR